MSEFVAVVHAHPGKYSYRDTPMPLSLGQKLLRILDLLVDMGDRRSAALQLGESFREIKVA